MENYSPLRLKGRFGLNTRVDQDQLAPGEASVASNLDYSHLSIAKRRGKRPILAGSIDNVLRGGAPPQSLYLTGEEWWLEHDQSFLAGFADDQNVSLAANLDDRREFFHHRPGVIMFGEADVSGIRLSPKTADPDWAIGFWIWSDDLPLMRTRDGAAVPAQLDFTVCLASKGKDTSYQWALRAIPGTGANINRFYLVLTLYQNSTLTLGTDFYYQSGADRSWFEPNKKIWVGFRFDDATGLITSKYWIEGAAAAVSSTQAIPSGGGSLRSDGVGTSTYPVCIGRRVRLANRNATTPKFREMGFNGCVPGLEFWWEQVQGVSTTLELPANWGTVASNPPSASDWYVDREMPEEQLSTVDAGSIVGTTDLQLYFQFKPELLGTNPNGTANSGENHRIIRPRFRNGGLTEPKAWVTGADATWLEGTGALGSFCLGHVPAGPSGQKFELADAVTYSLAHYMGYRMFAGGVRIPFGQAYMRKNTTTSGLTSFEWPDAFSIAWYGAVDALPTDTARVEVIWQMNAVRRGTGGILADYNVSPVLELAVAFDTGSWRFRWSVTDSAGAVTSIFSTFAVVEGTVYAVQPAVRWETVNAVFTRVMALYIDGALDASNTTGPSSKPFLSETSNSETALTGDLNKDDDDGRDGCYPMALGFSMKTAQFRYNTPAAPWSMRFGSQENGIGWFFPGNRGYWAFHNNLSKKGPNDGVAYRGESCLVGRTGALLIFHAFPSESEARQMAAGAPSALQIERYGAKLKSAWLMEEGRGALLIDSASNTNHIRFNPYPTVRVQTGVHGRANLPPVLGIWQLPRGGLDENQAPGADVYALAGGCLHRVASDASDFFYLHPIGRAASPELYDPRATALRLPTAFRFGPFLYVCPGLGPVKVLAHGELHDAGLSPPFGDVGTDQTNLGWREVDRDGTFAIGATDAASAGEQLFVEGGIYSWLVTHYNPTLGIESPPSRFVRMYAANQGLSPGNGWKYVTLLRLPKSPQRGVAKMRVYRTTKDGDPKLAQFLAEIDAADGYLDSFSDQKLGSKIDSWLNYAPPLNAGIGVAFGTRAVYSGVPEYPNSIWYSRSGQPGAVYPQYRIDLPDTVTGLFPISGVLLAMTRKKVYVMRDSGGDITFLGTEPLPMSVEELRSDVGCIGHHTGVLVEGLGWIFASERGLHVTNGYDFVYISGPIEPTFRTLNQKNAHAFFAASDYRKRRYILSCSTFSSPGTRNDTAVVWHWPDPRDTDLEEGASTGKSGFTIWQNFGMTCAGTVDDATTGRTRILLGDYSGQVFELDPPDATVNNDGVLSGPTSGTIQDKKLDPLGSGKNTRLKLVVDSSLPVLGNGLRGVRLYVSNAGTAWHTQPMIVLGNDANWVTVEAAGAKTTDPTGFEWRLGAFYGDWRSGKLDLGQPTAEKEVGWVSSGFGPGGGTTLTAEFGYDDVVADSKVLTPSLNEDSISELIGRGKRVQIRYHDGDLPGGRPDNFWEITSLEIVVVAQGRASYAGY